MKRIIAYIYHYKKDKDSLYKCENAGFCRTELCDDKISVAICLKDNCGVEGAANVYMLKDAENNISSENQFQKIKLDKSHMVCCGVLKIKLCLESCMGIYVECGGRIYAALWKECCENIRIVEGENKQEKKREEIKDIGKIDENSIEKGLKRTENKRCIEVKTDKKESHAEEEKYAEYTRIYNRLCKIRMVLNGLEYPAVKLKPQEMIMLPRSCWRLANNIFVMESYYRYGHILFMQYDNKYVLAVPWQRQPNIEARAKRFGFTKIVVGYEYGRAREEKDYWIMNL